MGEFGELAAEQAERDHLLYELDKPGGLVDRFFIAKKVPVEMSAFAEAVFDLGNDNIGWLEKRGAMPEFGEFMPTWSVKIQKDVGSYKHTLSFYLKTPIDFDDPPPMTKEYEVVNPKDEVPPDFATFDKKMREKHGELRNEQDETPLSQADVNLLLRLFGPQPSGEDPFATCAQEPWPGVSVMPKSNRLRQLLSRFEHLTRQGARYGRQQQYARVGPGQTLHVYRPVRYCGRLSGPTISPFTNRWEINLIQSDLIPNPLDAPYRLLSLSASGQATLEVNPQSTSEIHPEMDPDEAHLRNLHARKLEASLGLNVADLEAVRPFFDALRCVLG